MEKENQNIQNDIQNDEVEIDLKELFYELKKKIWMIVAATVLGASIFGIFSKVALTPQYTSTSTMYVLSKETTLTTLADLQIGSQLTKDYKVLITSRPVLQGVIDELGLEMNYKTLRNRLEISNPGDTRILTVSIEDADPQMAKMIVDEVAGQASEFIGEIMEMVPPKIVEEGEVATVKTSPSVKKNAMIGGLLGAFAVCAFVVITVLMNDSIQTEADVEKYLGLSVLAVVPERESAESGKKRGKNGKNGKNSSMPLKAGKKNPEEFAKADKTAEKADVQRGER